MDISRHPIFSLPTSAPLQCPAPSTSSSPRQTTALVRTSELLVASQSTIRLANLSDFKSFVETGGIPSEARYSELDFFKRGSNVETTEGETKELCEKEKFDILQVVPNQTERLVAVVGHRQVGVFILPRKGWHTSAGERVPVNYYPISPYNHSQSSAVITSVQWHPNSLSNATLLVLTIDGILREYDLLSHISEEAQVVDFNAAEPLKRFPTTDLTEGEVYTDSPEARRAVSFCFGKGDDSWGQLTLYGLMQNGDVYAVCPYIPKNALLNQSYVQNLSVVVNEKFRLASMDPKKHHLPSLQYSSSSSSEDETLSRSQSFTQSFVHTPTRKTPAKTRGRKERQRNEVEECYRIQMKYVRELQRQIDLHVQSQPQSKGKGKAKEGGTDVFKISPPSEDHVHSIPIRQGPFLLQPSPVEIEDDEPESSACQLLYLSYCEEGSDRPVGLFLISWKDGRIDVCLEMDKVEPRWNLGTLKSREASRERRSQLPVLLVWESIDLNLRRGISKKVKGAVETSWSSFIQDPMYPDEIVYVYHSFGVHKISMTGWLMRVWELMRKNTETSEGWERLLRENTGSSVQWILNTSGVDTWTPVCGVVTSNDVYLGYSLLCTTSLLQTISIPMSLKIDPSTISAISSTYSKAQSIIKAIVPKTGITLEEDGKLQVQKYDSLLRGDPFKVPELFLRSAPPVSLLETQQMEGPLAITPDTLKFLGKAVGVLRGNVREIFAAGDGLQDRIKLQIRELHRQLEKIVEAEKMKEENVHRYKDNQRKLKGLQEKQSLLEERLDRILVKVSDWEGRHMELSVKEREWIAELETIEAKVEGVGEDDEGKSLKNRIATAANQLSLLKPDLQSLNRITSYVSSPKLALVTNGPKSYTERARNSEMERMSVRTNLGQIQQRFMRVKLQEETVLLKEMTERALKVEGLVDVAMGVN